MTTTKTKTKWSYIPFFPGEPIMDPREPPVPPDYDHLVGLNPQKMAILVSIYEGKARIHIAAPEDAAEQIANAYADAYAGSSLGDPSDSSPIYCSAVEEIHHVLFRTNQNHDMPVRVFMRGPKGHSGVWSDPLPNGHDIEFRDVSSHLFDGVPAFSRRAPRARIYLQFINEHVGPMEEKATVRGILGTPHRDRIRHMAEGKVWSASEGWHFPTYPTSLTSAQYKGGVSARPLPSPGQSDFRDIFTRREASHTFSRTEVRATVVTPIGDNASLNSALELLDTWRRQARFLGVDMADYDLWTLEVLQAPTLKGKEAKAEWYQDLTRAVEELEFYPHGGNPVNRRDLTLRECLVLQPLPWGKRHKCLSYRPPVSINTQSISISGPGDGKPTVRPLPSANSPPDSLAPPAPTPGAPSAPSHSDYIRMGGNPKDRTPVHLSLKNLRCHIFGRSGSGKTTLLLNLSMASFRSSMDVPGVVDIVISSHGDIFRDFKDRLTVPEAAHVIEIVPANMLRDGRVAIGMNLLRVETEGLSPENLIAIRNTISGDVAQIVSAREGSKEMGVRIKRNFGMVVRALLHIPELETTLYDVPRVLSGKGRTRERSEVARRTTDVDARNYLEMDLPTLDSNTLQSSQNKANYFSYPFLRAALCQRGEGVVTMYQLIRENKVILIDLAQERLTREESEYLGSAYLTMIWLVALRHWKEGSPDNLVIRLWVDEWPDIASESFANMLRGGRKYGIGLGLATQAVGNVPNGKDNTLNLLPQLTGNVNTWITFQTDEDTARLVAGHALLERFGFDYRHYMGWPPFYAGVVHEHEYADMIIDPKPPVQTDTVRRQVEEIIHRNTWRYAKVDNSTGSPFSIGKEAELDVLEAFAKHGTMTPDQAILLVPQHRSIVWPVIDILERYHFLVKHKDPGKKIRYQITALGAQELRKYGRSLPGDAPGQDKKMDGGDPHDATLERARRYLQAEGRQVGPKIKQEVGKSNPDFTHAAENGTLVADEVEDRASHPDQISKNYQKANGKPVCFWAVDLDTARRIVDTLGDQPNYQVHVDQGTSFSRYGPGVPKEEEPISEEQDLVELSIVALIKEGRYVTIEGRRGFDFKDIMRALPKPLAYQKVRSVLERMVGDTVYAIRERRPEQGGPLVILNDAPGEEPPVETSNIPTPVEVEDASGDVEMVFDTCVDLSNAGKTFVHHDRGARISLRFSDVYDALPKRISLARFKEVVATLLAQDDISEVVLRPNESAILVIDPPETGIVDNKMALEATPDELYRGLLPAAIAQEKSAPKVTSPGPTPTSSQSSPALSPSTPRSSASPPEQGVPGSREGVWEISLRIARDKWQRRQKSFLTEDGKHVAVKFDTLYGVVKTTLVRGSQGTNLNLNPNLLVRTLKEHGVEVESRAPPPHWTQTWHERLCLFPLAMLLGEPEEGTSPPTLPLSPTPPTPLQTAGPAHMVQVLKVQADQLRTQGKVLDINGRKAVRVSDLGALYAPWAEADMAAYLSLHHLPTERVWIQAEKRKVRVWFAWD